MENHKNYFTTGEFAKLCGTTKATLFHYDEQGVLKPEMTGENGYRYYGAKQYLDFDLIHVLQEAGSSLAEIKEFARGRNPDNFIIMLKEKKKRLEQEREELARMQKRLESVIRLTEGALEQERERPYIEEQPEEHLIVVPVGEDPSFENQVKVMGEHFSFCKKNRLGEDYPLGSILNKKNLLSGCFKDDFYYSRIHGPIDSDRYFRKPAGTYLVMLHEGFYDTVPEALKKMLAFADEKGWRIAGNAYEYDAIGYLAAGSEREYVLRLSVQVERDV